MATNRIKYLIAVTRLLALVAGLALVACEGHDDGATATPETATSVGSSSEYDSPITDEEAEPGRKSCGGFRIAPPGQYFAIKVEVVNGNVPCDVARRVMKGQYEDVPRDMSLWSCDGSEGFKECEKKRGRPRGTIRARFYCRDYLEKDRARCRSTFGLPAPSAKVAFDSQAYVGFGLEGRVLTVSAYPTARSKTRDRLSGARIRATCGHGFTGGQGDPRQERTRFWPAGAQRVRFRFPRDISRIARWCRLEDPVVGHVAFVKFRRATLPAERKIERIGNSWARLYGAGDPAYCQYTGQPLCERLDCERPGHRPIENCRRPSPAFRNSFQDARVEDIVIRGDRAAARFSNGEAIELGKDLTGFEHASTWWWIAKVGGHAGREFFKQ